jgi:hypothetical protein
MSVEKDIYFFGDTSLDSLVSRYGQYYGEFYFEKIQKLKECALNEFIENLGKRCEYLNNSYFIIPNQKLIDRTEEMYSLIAEFLVKYDIEVTDVFDATGMKKKEWRDAIEDTDYILVMNAGFCNKEYHNLKTRAGHCAICNPRNVRLQQRYYDSGYIYVAHSDTLDLIKIGVSKDPDSRVEVMNNQGYGDFYDWTLEYYKYLSSPYKVESLAHNYLNDYRFDITFERLGITETSREIFDCTTEEGIDAIEIHLDI